MTRTTAALAATATLLALLLSGCGDDSASSTAPSSTAASGARPSGPTQIVDNVKAGAFVVNFRGAFPKLAEGKDDAHIAAILTETCDDIKAGKSEDEIVGNITTRASGKADPSAEEAKAVYQMAKLMC